MHDVATGQNDGCVVTFGDRERTVLQRGELREKAVASFGHSLLLDGGTHDSDSLVDSALHDIFTTAPPQA